MQHEMPPIVDPLMDEGHSAWGATISGIFVGFDCIADAWPSDGHR
jgi:hypothetical protein